MNTKDLKQRGFSRDFSADIVLHSGMPAHAGKFITKKSGGQERSRMGKKRKSI